MKRLKKITAFTLIICYSCFTLVGIVDAKETKSDGYAIYDQTKSVPYTKENVKKLEKRVMDYSIYETNNYNDSINPNVDDPGEGALTTEYTSKWSSGIVYWDDSEASSVLSTILDVGLTIAGFFVNDVKSIILDVASLTLDLSWDEIDATAPGEAKLGHSYSYYDHLGQVYTKGNWVTKVDIEKREWYRHELATFSTKAGYTRTKSYDFTLDNGYPPIKEEYKEHFSDNQWILNKTYELYITGAPNYVDAWTH